MLTSAPRLPTAFLGGLSWEERWLELEADVDLDLPAYTGATLRGALGAVLRPELCAAQGPCGEVCAQPARCPFYGLFEQSRSENGQGSNVPKPLILEAPLGEPLRAIACGGPVTPPFELHPGQPLPELRNDWRIGLRAGTRLELGLRVLGPAGAALDGVVEGLRRHGLEVKGGRLRLTGVRGGRQTLHLEPAAGAQQLRLALTTPTLIRAGSQTCLDPEQLAPLMLKQAVVRAVTVFNTFFAGPADRIPFVDAAFPEVILIGRRLLRYRLTRHSYRQDRWMDFDGVVGVLEWEGLRPGALAEVIPWLRAAEVLHLGQKATFGLGRVELTVI